jgi:hypothetical protein
MSAALTLRPGFALPLSWAWTGDVTAAPLLRSVPLANGKCFVSAADLPVGMATAELVGHLRSLSTKGVLIKGCDAALADAFTGAGGRVVLGHSARIDLAGYKLPGKVRNLAKRSAADVRTEEVALSEETTQRFTQLEAALRDPLAPRIEHVYRTRFEHAQRAFAARAGGGKWVGAVTLTRYGAGRWHIEQLARHPQSPPGTMEQLLAAVIAQLQAEGGESLNLGEVPLVYPEHDGVVVGAHRFTFRDRLLQRAAPLLSRLAAKHYGVRGLLQFKNKFQPQWEERYFCGYPSLSLWDLFCLVRACGIMSLVW